MEFNYNKIKQNKIIIECKNIGSFIIIWYLCDFVFPFFFFKFNFFMIIKKIKIENVYWAQSEY